jgi:hypothetical protein
MNLAEPAPRVDPAVADRAERAEPAVADRVQQSEPIRASAAARVEPAAAVDDPMQHAPSNVSNNVTKPSALSVQTLRGEHGADFESYAAVLRGAPEKNFLKRCLPCIYDERDFVTYGEVKKYALIKGESCFIYGEETDPSPLYAIPLSDLKAVLEDRDHPDPGSITISPMPDTNKSRPEMVTVLLKSKLDGSQQYQFTFDTSKDRSRPKRFMEAVERAGGKSRTGPVTASVVHAKQISKEAKKAQPDI